MPAKYQYNDHRNIVQGVYRVAGRRIFRKLAAYKELDGLSDSASDAVLESAYARVKKLVMAEPHAEKTHPGQARFSTLWQQFIDASAATKAPGTIKYYTRTGNEFLAAVGDPALRKITLHHVDRFITALKKPRPQPGERPPKTLSSASVNIRLQNLNTFLRWAYERHELDRYPRITLLRREKRLPLVHRADDLRRLLYRLKNPRDTTQRLFFPLHLRVVMMALGAGLRRSEIFWLRWDQIDTAAGKVHVRFQPRFNIKEGKEKSPYLAPFLLRYLKALRRQQQKEVYYLDRVLANGDHEVAFASPDVLTKFMGRHYDKLEIPPERRPKAMHGFRAHYATALRESGVDIETIRKLLGQSDISVTRGYFAESDTQERLAVANLRLPPANKIDYKNRKGA